MSAFPLRLTEAWPSAVRWRSRRLSIGEVAHLLYQARRDIFQSSSASRRPARSPPPGTGRPGTHRPALVAGLCRLPWPPTGPTGPASALPGPTQYQSPPPARVAIRTRIGHTPSPPLSTLMKGSQFHWEGCTVPRKTSPFRRLLPAFRPGRSSRPSQAGWATPTIGVGLGPGVREGFGFVGSGVCEDGARIIKGRRRGRERLRRLNRRDTGGLSADPV